MKKSLLLKSVGAAAVLLFSATSALAATAYEGNLYETLSTRQPERGAGAMGPIRSYEAIGSETSVRYEGDMYDKFREPSQALRGAQGPIRSDAPGPEDRLWKDLYERSPVLGGGNG